MQHRFRPYLLAVTLLFTTHMYAQPPELDACNVKWFAQSKNASESMPCGGGDIGLNVWVENNELLLYVGRSGSFDEHNTLLKSGRIRIRLSPHSFDEDFVQELDLKTGSVIIRSGKGKRQTEIRVWVDVFLPVIHVETRSAQALNIEAVFESWRYRDRPSTGKANNANAWKWAPQAPVIITKDSIGFAGDGIQFFHRNPALTVFDATVQQQGLESKKDQLYNPLRNLTSGGFMKGSDMVPAGYTQGVYADTDYKGWKLVTSKKIKKNALLIYLHTDQAEMVSGWQQGLDKTIRKSKGSKAHASQAWWKAFWNRSFILSPQQASDTSSSAQVFRNYQLFRYMLGCNANGDWPTKFNGGLFTYDPVYTDSALHLTPDHRNWGGGTHTAQNQRLVYFPLIKSGDFDLMQAQFSFYLRLLRNAEIRSAVYWQHAGACFTEQMENFGLPNPAEYGWKRPAYFDKGVEYNAWLEYQWDTVLEFCLMMLEQERYRQQAVKDFVPFIESCLRFFDEHYQHLARQRGRKTLDGNQQLVLYPGSAAETYKMANNASSTIAALKVITERMLQLPASHLTTQQRLYLDSLSKRIPPLPYSNISGKTVIAPAKTWERINNVESPQLYPVFPWGLYGIGKPDLDIARNTYWLDSNVVKFRSHTGWKQDNIFAARLGLTGEARRLTLLKLQNSGRRFPAFWGPGFDWTPDHNWGGSGMIGLQEMLLQADDKKIYLLPAWPRDWDVHFKLHAPYNTTVEAKVSRGKITELIVIPESRKQDIINMFEQP